EHRPRVRRVALLDQPGVVVVGDGDEVEPRLLGAGRVGHQLVGWRLLAQQRVSVPGHGWQIPARGASTPGLRPPVRGNAHTGTDGPSGREVAMPGRQELPSTIERSPKKAQETWIKAHDSAVETYGEGRRAHQTAYAALKHSFEKVGDHWEPKGRKGPSDRQAAGGRGQPTRPTAGGVDAN